MMNKKGQGDFILRVFSIIAYAIVLMIVLMFLKIPGCDPSKQAQETIQSDDKEVIELRAAEQLSAYLRTEMPDLNELNSKIDSLASKGDLTLHKRENAGSRYIDSNGAKQFLKEHPEIYVGKTYGEFISALYAYRDSEEEVKNVFDVVTKALFYKKQVVDGVEEYYTDMIIVMYNSGEGDPYYRDLANVFYDFGDLVGGIDLSLSSSMKFKAIQMLPVSDKSTLIAVMIEISKTREEGSLPTP